jgi:predicted N-acetyltransferase YhbS
MASELDIHAASPDEQLAVHRNVFDIWSKGLSLEDHLRYRLTAPMHQRATWFVGCVDGRVVTSLASYPVRFRAGGQELPGIAIGSVYTLAEFRGQGFAPRLLEWTENHQRERQASLSVLYCDINPEYYARLGYVLCPSLEGWRDPRDRAPASSPTYRLIAVLPQMVLPAIMKLYTLYHGAAPLSIARDSEYWAAILKKSSDDRFFALEGRDGTWAGYVRVGVKGDAWRIVDFALSSHSEDLAQSLYAALVVLARAGGACRVGGWLPDEPAAKQWFPLTPRRTEITMIKPLEWRGPLDDELIAATSRFCEIDHV